MATVTLLSELKEPLRKMMTPEATKFMYQTFYNKMFQYIPFVTGNLATDYTIEDDGIHFNAIYADYQYFGVDFNFTKDQHPLAQARWANVAWDIYQNEIYNEIKNYIER